MENHVDGKVILITGAGAGFGRLIAERTAKLGAQVVLADIDQAAAEASAERIKQSDGQAVAVGCDVADLAQMYELARRALEAYSRIDVMVNNAGVMPLALYEDHAKAGEAWDRCIDINFKGVLHGMSCVYDAMIAQGRGQIVNISSIYGNYPVAGAAVYGATKAAVNFLSESLRQESQGRIKVTTIRPTGVPGTGLGAGVINPVALQGILGANATEFMEKMVEVFGENPPAQLKDPNNIEYFSLSPELLADQVVFAINQPWGVSISDLTVRASGDSYMV